MKEIGDYWTAREFDNEAMRYIRNELLTREFEREQRDREFWVAMFGGDSGPEIQLQETSLEDNMGRSALAQ